MRNRVRLAAGIAAAVVIAVLAVSCDDSTGPDRDTYTATLSGANEVPPTNVPPSNVTGTGVATFVDRTTHFEYTLSVTGLTGVSASHIHGPASTTVNASVIINLFTPNGNTGAVNGVIATGIITDAQNPNFTVAALRAMFDAGTAYVNVHTAANGAGAIRGQIARSN